MSGEAGEKSFAPTPKRRKDAAAKGDVLRSRDMATAVSFGSGVAGLALAGPVLFEGLLATMRAGLAFDRRELAAFDPAAMLLPALGAALLPVLALGGAAALATIAAQLGLGDGRFLPENLAFKGSRLDPLAGLRRMVGLNGLAELAKSLLKLAVLGAVCWWWGAAHLRPILGLGAAAPHGQLALAWSGVSSLLLWLAAGLCAVAAVDWPVEWLRRTRRLRMSRQEVMDEHKEAEGSPENKAAQRQRQRQLARGGVAKAVAEADFILANPAHFSVALAYDPARAAAPVVLAKGRDAKALAMRELAAERRVPVLDYPALARSVYFTSRENQTIREELYAAVASVLAFVLALKRGEARPRPSVDVPPALRFDAAGNAQG